MATSEGAVRFDRAALAQLSAEQRRALGRVRWLDRLTSLWAPVTIFGIAFTVYLVIVETWVCSFLGLQPVLKVFGVLMLLAWVALVVSRVALKPFSAARRSRASAEELLAEVAAVAGKRKAELKGPAYDALVAQSAALLGALGSPEGFKAPFERLVESSDKQLKKWRAGGAGDFAGGFVKALAVALLIRTVLVEPFKIPSGSMIPTLEIGDQIFVNKFIYGVRIPFVDRVLFEIVRPPKRGDVIVFNNRLVGKDFIKRIMGVPGDRVTVKNREITVNGRLVPAGEEAATYQHWEQFTRDQGLVDWVKGWFDDDWVEQSAILSRETLDSGQQHLILNQPRREVPTDLDFVVPERSVFVMGDNRDNSEDSRFGLGGGRELGVQFVPFDTIKGKATLIWLSLGHGGLLSSIFGGTGIRTDRFFQSVTMCGSEPKRTGQ